MDEKDIRAAMADISGEKDPTEKCLLLASLLGRLWLERGVQLVVVGGSAIELLTDGAYASGDLDLCSVTAATVPIRQRQEIMGMLGGNGGPRNWQVAGMYVDLLGPVESFAKTPFRRLQGRYGEVLVMKPEDLLVERILVAFYPGDNPPARNAAKKLLGVILDGAVDVDWNEVRRIADLPEYKNLQECANLVEEVANELKVKNPFNPN